MVCCGHAVLCAPCAEAVNVHVRREPVAKGAALARLLCPICRGFEFEAGADADSVFTLLDRDSSGVLQPSDLMLYLLVGTGQDAAAAGALFRELDVGGKGLMCVRSMHVRSMHARSMHARACTSEACTPEACTPEHAHQRHACMHAAPCLTLPSARQFSRRVACRLRFLRIARRGRAAGAKAACAGGCGGG